MVKYALDGPHVVIGIPELHFGRYKLKNSVNFHTAQKYFAVKIESLHRLSFEILGLMF